MQKNKISYLVLISLFVSMALSFYFSEDSTGGAQNDYNHHEKFIYLFAENFTDTFFKYGTNELMARNSPVFYIFLSFLVKVGIDIETINFANIIVIPIYLLIFINCIRTKYKFIDLSSQILFSSIILLSPTIRSLTVWPYPFIWGLLFFLLSIYFFLKFKHENHKVKKIKYSLYNIFFLALSSYITPNFSIFAIFYFINFFNYFKNSKELFFIIILNILLAIPAFYYYLITDFYIFKYTIESVEPLTRYNFINKIIIIISLIFFYFLPFINLTQIKNIKFNVLGTKKSAYITITLCIICFFLFNFPTNLGFGGGFFFHLSNKLLNNNYLLFLIFIFAIIIFDQYKMFNSNNIVLFFCLIAYNTQTSIYHKYFDPLIYFMIMFLFKFNANQQLKLKNNLFYKIFIFYSFFWILSIYKKLIVY